MALHEFQCRKCGIRFEKFMHVSEYQEQECPECGSGTDEMFDRGNGGFRFKLIPGKPTGIYEYDYGKKATWDCTAPGKMDYLKREGIISDPFERAA
jgi:putative FmdB family regulatory protein